MNIPLSFNLRGAVVREFSALQARALRAAVWAKLAGRKAKLAPFPEGTFQTGINRKSIGVKDIPVDKIIGTLYRHTDFDDHFRPLKKHLQERWVNIYLLHRDEGWPPILVHKVDDHYYVEDGHHRVSVARALGILFVQARVWEYPNLAKAQGTGTCAVTACQGSNSVRKYAPATD